MPEQPVDVVVGLGDHDVLAGRLFSHRRRGRESASFVYEPEYIATPEAYALDPALPLTQGAHQTPVGVPMFRAFMDAAPDRWGRTLITRAEKQRAREAATTSRSLGEIDTLLGVRDDLRQGAIRFREPLSGEFLANDGGVVPQVTDLPRLLELAEHVEADHASEAELQELLRVGSSLGGARPKTHVIDEDGRVAIAKFPSMSTDTWNVMAWEKVALDLAREAGIRVPDSRLLRIASRSVLIVHRFDRQRNRRIGYASAMTMLEASDGDIRSYLDLAAVIEEVSSSATADLHELWRRIVFGILISNTDDHLRNHAFLHVSAGTWTLSPAFDLNPNPAPGRKHLSTAIDGSDTAASIGALLEVANFFRLTTDDAISVVRAVLETAARWHTVASAHGIPATEISEMEWAFEHGETEAARRLVHD